MSKHECYLDHVQESLSPLFTLKPLSKLMERTLDPSLIFEYWLIESQLRTDIPEVFLMIVT